MNQELQDYARQWLKERLQCFTDEERRVFLLMYSPEDLTRSMSDVVDGMLAKRLDWAMVQVRNTLRRYSGGGSQ